MSHHWPVLLAVVAVVTAVAVGSFRRDQLVQAASTPPVIPPLGVRVEPKAQAATPSPDSTVVSAPGPELEPPAALPKAPPAADPGAGNRTNTFAELRKNLQARWKVAPTTTETGGFKFAVEGARLEMLDPANWSILLYNDNRQEPQVETANFKSGLEVVTKVLLLDLGAPPTPLADGSKMLRTTCRLGRITLKRDPVTGNSCFIQPVPKTSVIAPPRRVPEPPVTGNSKPPEDNF